jgi:predicted transposase/invertase (TIGR01784 family)
MSKKYDVHQPDDRFFKSAMTDPKVVKAYLQHFYPEIAGIADLSTLQQHKVQSLRPNLKLFSADIVYRCQLKGESEAHFYFCLLFEHKSEPDEQVAVQIGLYIFLLLREQVKAKKQPLESVLPLLFYNGKASWQPKRIREIFKGHPGYEVLKPYLPDFHFLFEDAHRLPPEELLKLDLSYFRSTVLSMALRHKPDLIFEYIEVIFEGADGKASVSALTHYILGVAERSEQEFKAIIENTDLEIIPDVMSTLEQILTRGRKEGMEKGKQKERIFHLLKTALKFPEMAAVDLADFTGLPQETVQEILDIASEGDSEKLLEYVREELLADIPLSTEEVEKLKGLAKQLVQ